MYMKNKSNFFNKISWSWILIGLVLGFWCVILFRNYFDGSNKTPQICNETTCFTMEIAATPEEQQQGLMYRESMPEKEGMIFIFPQMSVHNFWMKNTLIPLDMIWIDDQMTVVRILTAQPCEADPCEIYKPGALAKYVVELNEWTAEKYGITEWDRVEFKYIQ